MKDEGDDYDLELEKVAQRLLAPRAHSVFELRNKLRKREFENLRIENIIEVYKTRGWLNDEDFANRQSELLSQKNWGPNQIRKKLQRRGIASFLIENAISALDLDWKLIAALRMERKCPIKGEGEKRKKLQEKAFRHLVNRGFSAEIARQVVFFQD